MIESDHQRVIYLEENDFFFGRSVQNLHALVCEENKIIDSINDAIEVHQGQKLFKAHPALFEEKQEYYKETLKHLFSKACIRAREIIEREGMVKLYEGLEYQYANRLWEGLSTFGAIDAIDPSDIPLLLQDQPGIMAEMLANQQVVRKFDKELRDALMASAFSAELIIRSVAVAERGMKIYLPRSLSFSDIENIFESYLSGEGANLNYVRILSNWPSNNSIGLNLSRRIRVKAEKLKNDLKKALFAQGMFLEFNAGVAFSPDQRACKGFSIEKRSYTFVFGTEWLAKYTDYATIMNNFIYVFEIVSDFGLLNMTAKKHGVFSLVSLFGLHPINEYKKDEGFDLRNAQFAMMVGMYAGFLSEHSIRLESAIEWVFNDYFATEYEIPGFSLKLPTQETSWHDKCKSVGPEIERIIKAFQLYVEDNKIDELHFKYMSVSDFGAIPSLIDKKYFIEGPGFDRVSKTLFSDQSILSCIKKESPNDRSFFDLIRHHKLKRSDFHDSCFDAIDSLIDQGFIKEIDSYIKPTIKSRLLSLVWEHGAIPRIKLDNSQQGVADELLNKGYFSTSCRLLSPDEADYYNYMFNNSAFTDSVALRNKYDHASSGIGKSDDDEYQSDYYYLLLLVIGLTLKINEELSYATEKGGVEDFVDWPLIDSLAIEEMRKRRWVTEK